MQYIYAMPDNKLTLQYLYAALSVGIPIFQHAIYTMRVRESFKTAVRTPSHICLRKHKHISADRGFFFQKIYERFADMLACAIN